MQPKPIRFACGLAVALGAMVSVTACNDLTVPDLNHTSLQGLEGNPTVAGVLSAAQGLFIGSRADVAGFIRITGVFGREGYDLEPTEPRTVTQLLIGPLDPGSFGGGSFQPYYQDIQAAFILLHATDKVQGMLDPDKEAVRGFAQTMQAIDFMHLIATRDTFGLPIAVDQNPNNPPAPIVSKAAVFQYIDALLDSAQTHLQNAGAAFPFQIAPGFSAFSTPATFIQLNRAIKARVDVWASNYTAALSDLQGSFLSTAGTDSASLYTGAYYTFSTNSGDIPNGLFDLTHLYAHPSYLTDAQKRSDGSLDLRVQKKITTVPTYSLNGITDSLQFTMYTSFSAPIPLIRNEELILLRAEANLGVGNAAAALSDINFIRVNSGGLAPIDAGTWATMTPTQQLAELLYEKRYSLMWEQGERWIDWRHYGLLTELPLAQPNHKRFQAMPFPTNECLSRNPQPTGCAPVNGF